MHRFARPFSPTLSRFSQTIAPARQVATGSSDTATPLAAALVIGDEILSGSIQDSNTPWLAKLLHAQGVQMARFECVPDDAEVIKDSVQRLKEVVGPGGVLFTSGGIGPTHDDVTYQAIADACNTTCELHAPTVDRMRAHYSKRGLELNEARQRMATLPVGAEVIFTEGLDPPWVPLVAIDSIYVLPGIPRLYKGMLQGCKDRFVGSEYHTSVLYSNIGEGDLANTLSTVADKYKDVTVGSYPNTAADMSDYVVKIEITSRNKAHMQSVVNVLMETNWFSSRA